MPNLQVRPASRRPSHHVSSPCTNYLFAGDAAFHRRRMDAHGGIVMPDEFFRLALTASDAAVSRTDVWTTVTWSAAEFAELLEKVWRWGEEHGRKQVADSRTERHSWLDDGSAFRRFTAHLLDFLRRLILPRVRSTSRLAARCVELVAELQSARLPVGAVLPATLLVTPGEFANGVIRHPTGVRQTGL